MGQQGNPVLALNAKLGVSLSSSSSLPQLYFGVGSSHHPLGQHSQELSSQPHCC